MQPTVIEHLQGIGNDKWYDACSEALLEHDEPPHSAIAVLKRMNRLEAMMEVDDVLKGVFLVLVVFGKQGFHLAVNLFGRRCLHPTHLIGQALVVPNLEPWLTRIRGARLHDFMQMLDKDFGQWGMGITDNFINAPEVIDGLDDVVHLNGFVSNAYRVGFKDISCLVMREATTLDVVGVIREVYLYTMIDASL